MKAFNNLPKSARVWIYQSDKLFSKDQTKKITLKMDGFIKNWNNHGENLTASYQIKYNHFIILAVDENKKLASGCSIDSSVQVIKQIERELNIDLLNKLNISFKSGNNINIVSMSDFQKYAKENKINKQTIVFNNLVKTIGEFDSNWEIMAGNSWHKRFLIN